MTMNKKAIYIALAASFIVSAPAIAQDSTTKPSVETSEKNKNSKREPVDLAKFSKMEHLKAADTNGDGILSREEIEAHVQKMNVKRAADRMERQLDVNGDGKISLDAIEKHRAEKFAKLDKNKDGKLDHKELKAGNKYDKKPHGKRGEGKHGEGKHDAGKHGGAKHEKHNVQKEN